MFSYRKLEKKDFPKMFEWLNTKHVKEFWYPDSMFTLEEVSKKYKEKLDKGNVNMFIFSYNDVEIGYIQSYLVDEKELFKETDEMAGIDLFIGEIDYLYKGLGTLVIADHIEKVIPKTIKKIGIDPSIKNEAAIKSYKKVGFKIVNTEYSEYEKGIHHFMIFEREWKNLCFKNNVL